MHLGCAQCLVVGQVQEIFAFILLLCYHNFILLFVVGALCISVFTLDIIFMLLCDKLFDPACYLAFV
jgi:hypothetical protein